MSVPPRRKPSGRDGKLENSYRSYKASRPQLFEDGTGQPPMMVRTRHASRTPKAKSLQANMTTIQIGVIADNQEHIVSLSNTLYDNIITHSLIDKS